jgi:Protein of unknown function (DUF3240)
MTAQVSLTIVAARQLEQELLDYLSEQRDLVSAFTVAAAQGHGVGVVLPSTAEQVKGRAERIVIVLVLEPAAAQELLKRLKAAYAGANLAYWITPLLEFGVIQ